MLVKIISGGQTGADICGLEVAKSFGLQTGGWMPCGWKTLDGPKPDYEWVYNMVQTGSARYPARTRYNVRDSHGTLRLAYDFKTSGEECTMRSIKLYGRPYWDVNLLDIEPTSDLELPEPFRTKIEEAGHWLDTHRIAVLNVAGNSEQSARGIHAVATSFLQQLLWHQRAKGQIRTAIPA